MRSDAEKRAAVYAVFMHLHSAIREAGIFVTGVGLQPPGTSTTVRLRNEERLVQGRPVCQQKGAAPRVRRDRCVGPGHCARLGRYLDLDLTRLSAEATSEGAGSGSIADERLQMLFLCVHPAIDRGVHTPLMLQAVFGLTAEQIASASLESRAKEKIKQAKFRFDVPESSQMPIRLNAVLEAVYAAGGTGWNDPNGSDYKLRGLVEESIFRDACFRMPAFGPLFLE